jgi:uncharacterized membrane protein YdjX (TVP38/TMEM64 family)
VQDTPEQQALVEQPTPAPAASRSTSGRRWLVALVLLAACVAFYALGWHHYLTLEYLRTKLDIWKAEVQQYPVTSVLLFFVVYAAITGLSLPVATPLSLVAGALFGRWLGTAVVSLASTLGATVAFLTSRYLLRDWVQRRFGARLESLNQGVDRDGAYYLFTLRLVPVFPFFLINLGMGLTRMGVWRYTWVSLLGMLPGTYLYVNAATELSNINTAKDVLSPSVLVSLALLGIVPLALRKLLPLLRRR